MINLTNCGIFEARCESLCFYKHTCRGGEKGGKEVVRESNRGASTLCKIDF